MEKKQEWIMPPDSEGERVGYQIKVLERMFRKRVEAQMRKMGFDDISMMNSWIIDFLANNDGKTVYQRDLEQIFKVGKSSLSGTLKIMEEKGIIERKMVPQNARLKQVVLTDEAKKIHNQFEQGRLEMDEKVCKGLSEEEIQQFMRIVKKMQENLSE